MSNNKLKPIAFYLPQFHPIKENNEWWGEGFTEWTNVAKAKPNFIGHYQPHVPADLGFYDLRLERIQLDQFRLASEYGIYGFCYYYYWFNGKRLLELPLEIRLKLPSSFPFCICWANENWTRRWDGGDRHILMSQDYLDGWVTRFFDDVFRIFAHKDYIRVDGNPLLIVYRAAQIPDVKNVVKTWRNLAIQKGLNGLHLVAVQFHDLSDPTTIDFDAVLQFPPHCFYDEKSGYQKKLILTNPHFSGNIISYSRVAANAITQEDDNFVRYRGVMPSWDNTPRRQNTADIFAGSSPERFEKWFQIAGYLTLKDNRLPEKFIFINAWNEWGEGCHLEPDLRYGRSYLEKVKKVVNGLAETLPVSKLDFQSVLYELENLPGDIDTEPSSASLNYFRLIKIITRFKWLKKLVRLLLGKQIYEKLKMKFMDIRDGFS